MIDGDLAVVSGRYTFYVGDKFSHCGKDVFNLLRTEAGWKIAHGHNEEVDEEAQKFDPIRGSAMKP